LQVRQQVEQVAATGRIEAAASRVLIDGRGLSWSAPGMIRGNLESSRTRVGDWRRVTRVTRAPKPDPGKW
jgi:hypothetical protein